MEKRLIDELESYFASVKLPLTVQLGPGEKIIDVNRFVDVHLTRIKAYTDSSLHEVFYNRLIKLRNIIEENGHSTKQ